MLGRSAHANAGNMQMNKDKILKGNRVVVFTFIFSYPEEHSLFSAIFDEKLH
jgi:hypothetical protein